MEEVQGLEETIRGSGGFGSTGGERENDTDEKKKMDEKNERTEDKNETLKGSVSGRQRTEKSRKSTEGTSRLSRERQIISVKQLKRLVKKKTPVFLAVVWG